MTDVAEKDPDQKHYEGLKRPSMYHVVLHNDDFTPMEFVSELVADVFHISYERAQTLAYEVHTQGQASCGVFTYEIAETKAVQVMGRARAEDHPLQATVEPE